MQCNSYSKQRLMLLNSWLQQPLIDLHRLLGVTRRVVQGFCAALCC
jgi:hypothetical protein